MNRTDGLLAVAFVFDSIGYIGSGDPLYFQISFLLIGLGIISAGFSLASGRRHGFLLLADIVAGFLVVLSWILRLPFPGTPPDSALAVFAAGFGLTLLGQLLDGRLPKWLRSLPLPARIVFGMLFLAFSSYAFNTSDYLNRPAQDDSFLTLRGHRGIVLSVALSADNRYIASGGFDQTVRLWDASTGRELKVLRGHTDRVMAVSFSPNGRWLISGSKDSTARIWEVATGELVHVLASHSDRVTSLAFTSDGSRLATGSRDRTIKIWDAGSWRELRTLTGHSGFVWSISFSPDGNTLASGAWDGTVRLWDLSGSQQTQKINASARVRSVAFSPDGQWLEASDDDRARIWRMQGGEPRIEKTYPTEVVLALQGESAYAAFPDRTIRIHNLKQETLLRRFSGHADQVNALAVSKDGTFLVSASNDSTIKVWRVPTP